MHKKIMILIFTAFFMCNTQQSEKIVTPSAGILEITQQPKEIQKIISDYVGSDFGGGDYQAIQLAALPEKPTALVYSPDGKYLASAAGKSVKIWDTQTRSLIKTLDDFKESVAAIAYAPDNSYIAIGELTGRISLWDPKTMRIKKEMLSPHPEAVLISLEYTPTGNFLVGQYRIGRQGTSFYFYDTTRNLARSEPLSFMSAGDDGIPHAFSARGNQMAMAENRVYIFNIASSREIKELTGHYSELAYSPDGRYFAVAKKTLSMYNTSDYTPAFETSNVVDYVTHLAFAPDSNYLIYTGNSGTLTIAEINSEQGTIATRQTIENLGEITQLAVSAHGDFAIATADGSIKVMGKSLAKTAQSGKSVEAVLSPAYRQQSDYILVKKLKLDLPYYRYQPIHMVSYAPNKLLVSYDAGWEGKIIAVDIVHGHQETIFEYPTHSFAVSADNNYVLFSSGGTIYIFDIQKNRPLSLKDAAADAALTPSNQFLIIEGNYGGEIRFIDTQKLDPKIELAEKSGAPLMASHISFTPFSTDRKLIAVTGKPPTPNSGVRQAIDFYTITKDGVQYAHTIHQAWPQIGIFSPDGKYYAYSSTISESTATETKQKGQLHIRDIHNLAPVYILNTSQPISAFGYLPDGKTIWYVYNYNSKVMFLPTHSYESVAQSQECLLDVITDIKPVKKIIRDYTGSCDPVEQDEKNAPTTQLHVGGIIVASTISPDGTFYILTASGELLVLKKNDAARSQIDSEIKKITQEIEMRQQRIKKLQKDIEQYIQDGSEPNALKVKSRHNWIAEHQKSINLLQAKLSQYAHLYEGPLR